MAQGLTFRSGLSGRVVCFAGDVKMIPNEGMPSAAGFERRGNLYIRFNVDFPDIPFLKQPDIEVRGRLHG